MANGNDDQKFMGQSVAALIGGPLVAATKAQVMLAQSTIDFIKTVGYTADGEPRYFDFKFERPIAEGLPPPTKDGEGKTTLTPPTETVEIKLPALAMISIPNLQIDTLDIAFNIELRAVDEPADETEDKAEPVKLYGLASTHRENVRPTDRSAKYSFELHVVDKGMPEPLARLIDLLAASVAPAKISKNGPTKQS